MIRIRDLKIGTVVARLFTRSIHIRNKLVRWWVDFFQIDSYQRLKDWYCGGYHVRHLV